MVSFEPLLRNRKQPPQIVMVSLEPLLRNSRQLHQGTPINYLRTLNNPSRLRMTMCLLYLEYIAIALCERVAENKTNGAGTYINFTAPIRKVLLNS